MTVPPRGPRPIAEALRPRRATTFPLARVSVFSSGAASRRSWRGSSQSTTAIRTQATASSQGMHSRSFKRATFAKLAYAELLLFRRCEQLPPAHLHRAEGGNLQARHQTTQGLARPHSAHRSRASSRQPLSNTSMTRIHSLRACTWPRRREAARLLQRCCLKAHLLVFSIGTAKRPW